MGHLFPTSVLLTELRDRGHDIALRTLAAGVGIGRDLGFATEAVDPHRWRTPVGCPGRRSMPFSLTCDREGYHRGDPGCGRGRASSAGPGTRWFDRW